MIKYSLVFLTLFVSPAADTTERPWIDVTHTMECKDIAYVGPDGECYLGFNSYVMERFKRIEMNAYPWYLDNKDNNIYKVGRSLGHPKRR